MATNKLTFNPALLSAERPPGAPRRARKIGFLIYADFEILDLCGPLDAFYYADRVLCVSGRETEPGYETVVIAVGRGVVRAKCGLEVAAHADCAEIVEGLDTLVVVGGEGAMAACADAALVEWIRDMAPRVRRLASICTGAFLLAGAGLLDNRKVTTHWLYCDALARAYPRLRVEADRIFVRDGGVYTSGGITAGIDLALMLIEEDLGREAPRQVAGLMVVFLRRPGGQAQFSPFLQDENTACGDISELKAFVLNNLNRDLTVERLAEQAAMSPRNFARRFAAETGTTPARFVERARVEAARCRLEQTSLPLEAIALACGFTSPDRLRRAFRRHLDVGPLEYRDRFQSSLHSGGNDEHFIFDDRAQ
jgi:transcriptional regulator GlxA family with amidase domain